MFGLSKLAPLKAAPPTGGCGVCRFTLWVIGAPGSPARRVHGLRGALAMLGDHLKLLICEGSARR
jgi:hypothetical protein